jgi:protein O-mannosyl-transferase
MTESLQHVRQKNGVNTSPAVDARRNVEWIGLALVVVATFVVYWPAMNGHMVFDDDFYLTRPDLQSVGGLYRIWTDPMVTAQYYPLVHTAFWLEHKLWGDNFLGYHLANVVWHSLAVVLGYVILIRLKIPGALLAAAVFALHPVIVESVAWMTEQKNTLSTVFYLCAILVYLEFDRSRRRSDYFFTLILFAAALLTKTATVTFPVALLLIFWWQRGALSWRRDVGPLVPLFAMSIAIGLLTVWVERVHGAHGARFDLTFLQRILIAGRAIWFYLGKLLWPSNLTFIYPHWIPDPNQLWQWIFPVGAIAMTGALWAIRGHSRAPLAAWLFFCATLFPVLGFFNVYFFTYSFVADHFQYLASLGIISLAAAGTAQGLAHLEKPARYVGDALCVGLLVVLAALSIQQSPMYADIATLYTTTIERNPECWLAHNNLGKLLADAGNTGDAIAHYQAASRIKPDYADAHNNLANALIRSGHLPEALDEFRIAIGLDRADAVYHGNMASALTQMGRYQEAIESCHEALRLQPNYFDAHHNLGTALLHVGRLPEAIDEIRAAVALRPDDPTARNTLGAALLQSGQNQEAGEHIRHALEIRPNYPEAHNNQGQLLARTGRIPQAAEQFRQAIALNDNFAAAHISLGLVLAAQAKYEESIGQLEKAIKLGADGPDVRNNLGDSYRKCGKTNQAIDEYQVAVRLKPDFMPACANLAQTLALVNRSKEAIAVSEKAIEAARSTGQQEELEQFEQWLKHYQIELRRAADSAPSANTPAPVRQQEQLK